MATIYACDRCGALSTERMIRVGRIHFKNPDTGRQDMARTAGMFCEPCIEEQWPRRASGRRANDSRQKGS